MKQRLFGKAGRNLFDLFLSHGFPQRVGLATGKAGHDLGVVRGTAPHASVVYAQAGRDAI